MPQFIKNFTFGKLSLLKLLMMLLCLLLLASDTSMAQSITWKRTLNNRFGGVSKVLQAPDGGFLSFGGEVEDSPNLHYTTWIQKFSVFGDTAWKKIIDERNFFCTWAEHTFDHGYILCGFINDANSQSSDIYLYKTDSAGNKQWSKVLYGGDDIDQGYCVKPTPDSGYIVIGRIENLNSDVGIFKTNKNGIIEWSKVFINNSHSQMPEEVIVLADGYIIAGVTIYAINNADVLLMRINSMGDSLWTKNIGGSKLDYGYSIDFGNEGGYIVGGVSNSFNEQENRESYVVHTDTLGNVIWQKTYKGFSDDYCYRIRRKPNLGYVLVGSGDSVGVLYSKAKIRVINEEGTLHKESSFVPGNDENEFMSVETTLDGGYIIGGQSKSIFGVKQMYIVKADSNLSAIPIGILSQQLLIGEGFVLSQNFPNPFNPQTTIRFDVPKDAMVSVKIYDLLGREVFNYSGYQTAGTHELKFDGSNFASGMYFYSIETSGFKETKKMVLLK